MVDRVLQREVDGAEVVVGAEFVSARHSFCSSRVDLPLGCGELGYGCRRLSCKTVV